jgi:hypothetical protein
MTIVFALASSEYPHDRVYKLFYSYGDAAEEHKKLQQEDAGHLYVIKEMEIN